MRSLFRKIFGIVAVLFAIEQTALAMPEILPLDKVESGMTGVAYTIVDNSGVIQPFNVDIIGLMDNGKGSSKMIMAKASGEIIEKTGGVLQGMSGSPVYVDGKLVGALAASLKEMSPYTFFITPIESMLKLWDMPDEKALSKYTRQVQTVEEPADNKTEDNKAEENKPEESAPQSETKIPVEVITPENIAAEEKSALFFSGFNSTGLDFLKQEFTPLGFEKYFAVSSAGNGTGLKHDAKLEPGGAMGVAVVFGDFMVGATGTVTAVDGKKILGFGHSFTHSGNVNFFLTDSAVIGSISGESGSGVKISSVGNIIGRINQDREAGVAGIIGKFPSVVPISVTIQDKDLDTTETYNATIAYNENLIPKLGAAIAYTALSKTSDSLAESTVDVDFAIKTNVVGSGTLARKNTFYNATDVGQVAIVELMQALNIICSNTTQESNIFGIDVTMVRDSDRRTATLISAVPDKKKVKPGDNVNLTVTLQPYRKPTETIIVPYTVPLTRPEGTMTLDLHGGSLVAVNQQNNSSGVITPSTATPEQNYNEKIKALVSAGRNNQLVIEPAATPGLKKEKDLKKEMARIRKLQEKLAKSGKKITPATNKIDTNYIIDNVIQVMINVDKA